ncbi:MAG TPA: hypothetical protein VFW68_10035 [Rhodocyclaceae bacterium]|nr:hypothetical protein [Rhodocyclaceae bacterium]
MNSRLPLVPKRPRDGRVGLWHRMLEAQQRERHQLVSELSQIRGFMPLLMKRRNGQRWTRDERQNLQAQLHAMAHLSPYLVVLALPGSFALIPVLAWWLDRRRGRRTNDPIANA